MRRLSMVLLAAVLAAALLTGCGKADTVKEAKKKDLSGIWTVTEVGGKPLAQAYEEAAAGEGKTLEELLEEKGMTPDWTRDAGTLTLDKNGTAILTVRYMGESQFLFGTWELDGGEIVLYEDGEESCRLPYADGKLRLQTLDNSFTLSSGPQ